MKEILLKINNLSKNYHTKSSEIKAINNLSLDIYKNEILARYGLESSSQPLGISSFELSKLIPENFKSSLPTIEEIENELKDK